MWYGLKDVVNSMFGLSGKKSKLRKEEFWAIKDIGFQLRRGECLGLIGHNGVGKSTLLKMLNGLIRPDEGSIIMRGKVGALIELGAGFNPILTGRENIYVNGQLIGFSKKEIDEKLNAILDFAEIGEFIDSPIQNYSSGMKVRLGFAIAAQMEPDVLIIDEVLSVGDLGFVLKCFNAIDKMINKTAVIFVSHSMPQISRICTSIALLEKGKAIFQGTDVSRGIDFYYSKFANANQAIFSDNKNAEFIGVDFLADDFINGIPIYKWNMELAMRIKFHTAIEIDRGVNGGILVARGRFLALLRQPALRTAAWRRLGRHRLGAGAADRGQRACRRAHRHRRRSVARLRDRARAGAAVGGGIRGAGDADRRRLVRARRVRTG